MKTPYRSLFAAVSPLLAVVAASSCAETSSIEPKPCRPGCADAVTRLECDDAGRPHTVRCPGSDEACAAPVCHEGSCGYRPATGAPCGPDGLARCNDGYACLGPALKLTAIAQHTCAVTDDGKIWCWGNNQSGALGDGTTEDRAAPVLVRGLPGRAVAASAGYAHTCALMEDGSAYCWGDNSGGQINPQPSKDPILQPTAIGGAVRFDTIVAGEGHTCGTTAEHKVFCWGNTIAGQCGVDPKDAFAVGPTEIPGLDAVAKVQTVKNHTCALRTTDPTMVCWGSNEYIENKDQPRGKLGPMAAGLDYSTTPVAVDLGARVVEVGMGYESTYAITEDGFTYAWGYNSRGQLGSGTTGGFVSEPSQVLTSKDTPLRGAKELIRSDGSDLCAEMSDLVSGTRYVCWGGDDDGELGFGIAGMSSLFAKRAVALPSSAENLVRGENHGCFTATDESGADVFCYGLGTLVGNGTTDPQAAVPTPVRVLWDPQVFEAFAFPRSSQ